MSPSLTIGKVFFLSTRKLFLTKLYWVKGFGIESSFPSRSSKVIVFFWNGFGLALWKAIDSFRHDLGSSADAHLHQVSFGLSFISRLVSGLCTLWALVHHHLSVGCEDRLLRHPALPLVHQLSLVSPLDTFMMFYVFLYLLMQIIWTEAPWNIEDFAYLLLFIDAGLGATHVGEK